MFGAPPPGFQAMLDRKYQILGQQADARTTEANASANLANVRAALMPGQASAENDLTRARALGLRNEVEGDRADYMDPFGRRATAIALGREQANLTGQQAETTWWDRQPPSTAPREPQSMQQYDASGRAIGGPIFGLQDERDRNAPWTRSMGLPDPRRPRIDIRPISPLGFAKGTARVPGKGSGKKDTVPAKLAPGEAVLNKAAADNMGRGLIAALNTAGARKMGMV